MWLPCLTSELLRFLKGSREVNRKCKNNWKSNMKANYQAVCNASDASTDPLFLVLWSNMIYSNQTKMWTKWLTDNINILYMTQFISIFAVTMLIIAYWSCDCSLKCEGWNTLLLFSCDNKTTDSTVILKQEDVKSTVIIIWIKYHWYTLLKLN